jgi:hypothetical protein
MSEGVRGSFWDGRKGQKISRAGLVKNFSKVVLKVLVTGGGRL